MKRQSIKKHLYIPALLFAIIILSILAVIGYRTMREAKLNELQNAALEELERNQGTYDEQSIVLSSTSRAKAEELAELFNAELRITKDGRFARLTLPEGTNIRDIYANDDYRIYIEDMSADYEVYLSDVEDQPNETNLRLPQRPQYTVSDSDYYLQTYLDYLNLKNTWEYSRGGGVTVAVIIPVSIPIIPNLRAVSANIRIMPHLTRLYLTMCWKMVNTIGLLLRTNKDTEQQ